MSDRYGYIAIETLLNFCENSKDHAVTPNDFMRMARVQVPERKTARWIPRGCGCFECDECGERVTLNAYTAEKASDRFRFCYHCGARMEEGGE